MASDYFLHIDGIPGESTADGFRDQIEIESFSWGLSQTGAHAGGGGGGAAAGKVSIEDMAFVKRIDRASPLLALACASGRHIKVAVLSARRSGEGRGRDVYLRYTLTNVLVSSYHVAGSQGELPSDQFSLNFGRLTMDYQTMNADGAAGPVISVTISAHGK